MGWSVSRHSEPERKLDLFDRMLGRLRGAVRRGDSAARVAGSAERVRRAALAVIKATRALLTEYPGRDPDGRQARNLAREEERWLALPTEAIAAEYGVEAEPVAADVTMNVKPRLRDDGR
jgi:hypothetical protein